MDITAHSDWGSDWLNIGLANKDFFCLNSCKFVILTLSQSNLTSCSGIGLKSLRRSIYLSRMEMSSIVSTTYCEDIYECEIISEIITQIISIT